MTLEEKLDRIESLLVSLLGQCQRQEWYATDEFARRVGRSELTIRQWCRQGRIEARKKSSGRGAHAAWAIPHEELERFRREGLRKPSSN
jgi:transposase